MPNEYEDQVLYHVDKHVGVITLNRPAQKNAVNQNVIRGVIGHLKTASQDDDVWAVLFRANGDAFSSGHDLKQEHVNERKYTGGDMYQAIRHTYKPTVVAINGYALGAGAGIALSCDVRIMAESAKMGWPQAKTGMASTSGPTILAKLVPVNQALELLYTSDFISAQRVHELGLVNMVVPDSQLEAATQEFLAKVLRNAPLALRALKRATILSLEMSSKDSMGMTAELGNQLRSTADGAEGRRAFAEKRAPVWHNR